MDIRKTPIPLILLLRLLSVLFIVILGGGLGVIFMILYSTSLHEWGVIILGMAFVVGVPAIAAIIAKRYEKDVD